MTKILWAVKKGSEDWEEELITEVESRIPAASKWAVDNGFDRLRIATVDLSVAPDFRNTVSLKGT